MNPETYSTENFVKCLLCKETFRDARLLPCVHSFCISCLYSSPEANTSNGLHPQCPLCKKEFKVTDEGLKGLRKDPLIEKSVTFKTITSSRSPDKYCEECYEDKIGDSFSVTGLPKAECYCITCSQYLCRPCGVGHGKNKLSRNHGLVKFGSSHAVVFEQFRNSSSVNSCVEHREPMIRYCVNCRRLVCATCLANLHLQHQLLPVTEAAEGLRGELRGFIAGASNLASSTENGIQKIRNEVIEFTRKSEDCERTVSSAIDDLKRLVDAAGKALLEELRQLKQRRLDERQTELTHLRHRLGSIEHFTSYCTGLDEMASPNDLCEVFETLKNRFDELRAAHVLPRDEFEIVFERNKELFCSEENIIGKLNEMKNSNQNTAECNDSSHLLRVPWIERSEEQRGFHDLNRRFDKISSDSATHSTAKLDEGASISKTPTPSKLSRSCPRTFLSAIDYRLNDLSNEAAIQGCADHDQEHSADPSTESVDKVSTSTERGKRQLNEREPESRIVYVRSEFNGNFNEIKDLNNQKREQLTVVADSTSTITAKSRSNKRCPLVETIIIVDDSDSDNNDNTIKSNVKTTENLPSGNVKRPSLDKFETARISESQQEAKCTSSVFNSEKISARNRSDDLPIVRFDDDDEYFSSASSLDLVEYTSAPNKRKSKPRRKTFDRVPSSADEENNHDYLDVKTHAAHKMEMRLGKRKRKLSSQDHKEERQARPTLEFVHKLSGQSSDVYGVTHLHDILYIVRKKSLCTYQAKHPYSLLKTIQLKSIVTPNDVAACPKHSAVYITDYANYHGDSQRHCIWRVSADNVEADPIRWLSGIVEPYTVSVTRDGYVIFLSLRPDEENSSIEVRDHEANLVASVPLLKEMVRAEHAVQTSRGSFVVCHATPGNPKWTLSEVDLKGEILQRLDGSCVLLDEPKHLAVDADDRVFVANWKRGEVLVLPGGLHWTSRGGVFREGGTKDEPGRLCYVQGSNLLVVVNHMKQTRVYRHIPNAREVMTRQGHGSSL